MQKDTFLQNVNKNLVASFNENDELVLKTVYQENFYKVRSFVLQNSGSDQQTKDIYQDAFMALWQKIKDGRFVPQTNESLNSYLFTIAKNKWIDYLRSNEYKKMTATSKIKSLDLGHIETEEIEDHNDHDLKLEKAMKAFNNLGDACKALLTKVYFEKKSMQEIAIELELDAASTRNKKYRCMQQLRELALNNQK